MDTFIIYGKLAAIKETDKWAPISHRTFDSGWEMLQVNWNVLSGTNRIMCNMSGGRWMNTSKNVIKTFTAGKKDENGKFIKGEQIDIPWDKRFDEEYIKQIPDYRKTIIDLGDPNVRRALQNIVDGKAKDSDMEAAGVSSVDEAKAELEKSNKRRHVFLDTYDACEFMKKVLASDKVKDTVFRISGTVDRSYNSEKGSFYDTYVVNKIEIPYDNKESAELYIDFHFGADPVDDSDIDETNTAYINGFSKYYDNRTKTTGFYPITLTVHDAKKAKEMKRKLSGNGEIMNVGLIADIANGAATSTITYDDLSDEDKADVDSGLLDLNEVIKALGGNKVGGKVKEFSFNRINPYKKKIEETIYTMDDMVPAKAKKEESTDLFAEDDDEL